MFTWASWKAGGWSKLKDVLIQLALLRGNWWKGMGKGYGNQTVGAAPRCMGTIEFSAVLVLAQHTHEKTCWLLLWCELLVPERAPCRKILRGNMKQGCSQEAHVPRRSLEYRKDYSNCPPSCRLGSRRSQRSSVNQPLNKSPSLLLEKILFWAGFRTNKCIEPLECRDSSDFCEMASYPLPKQALCKAVANGFTNETSWETIAMFNRQCDA